MKSPRLAPPKRLVPYDPRTVLRDWSAFAPGQGFLLGDALTGVLVLGATGSGKTSGPATHLAYAYLVNAFGGAVLCAKKEERRQWEEWARATGRTKDLVIITAGGGWRFNFLDWEAERPGEGDGYAINVVALLDEVAGALAGGAGGADGSGDNRFFADALHYMNSSLVDLCLLAGLPVTLPNLRAIMASAPKSLTEAQGDAWQQTSVCAAVVQEADQRTSAKDADPDARADFAECRTYWLQEYPALSERTRTIIDLSFGMLVRPFVTRPLRRLFSLDTTIRPEDTFAGKIIIVDLPVQEYGLAGRVANLVWKYCFQIAVLRRTPPQDGSYLRPVFLWADEAQNFVTPRDAEYQAVARSAGGCTVYLTQNRASYRRVLGDDDAVDSLLGNLQCKFFCQNTGETNEWAARLLGERWVEIIDINTGQGHAGPSSGASLHQQRRYFVEPADFTTLRRGGPKHGNRVDTIVYNGGSQFPAASGSSRELLPYAKLTFQQSP